MRLMVLIAFLLFMAAPLIADQIHLKDGRVLKGRVIFEDEEKVVLQAKYGKVTILKENIEKIVRGEEEQPEPAKKVPRTTEELLREYVRGDDSLLGSIKSREDAVWVAKRLLRHEREQSRRVRLEALIKDLTRAEPEEMEAAERFYKKGLACEKEWRREYEALKKEGKSHTEATKATAEKLAEAITAYKKALDRWRFHDKARLRLGVLYYQARLLEKAIEVLDVLVVADEPDARRTVGACYFLLGKYEAALRALDELEDGTSLDLRIQCLMRKKQFRKALHLARKMQKKRPEDPRGLGYEGMALLALGRYRSAAKKLREAYEAGEHSRSTVYSLAAALARTKSEKDLREAETLLRSILKEDPGYVPAVIELVRLLLRQKRKEEARDVVKTALDTVRKGSRSEKLLKKILTELGK